MAVEDAARVILVCECGERLSAPLNGCKTCPSCGRFYRLILPARLAELTMRLTESRAPGTEPLFG